MTTEIDWARPKHRHPPAPILASRQCRYCTLPYKVGIDYDGPPFCDGCRADLASTKRAILRDLDSILHQMDAAAAPFEAIMNRRPDLWAKLDRALELRALGDVTEAELTERWRARWNDPDPDWRILLKGYEEREVALAPLASSRDRLERALLDLADIPTQTDRDLFGARKAEYELPEDAKPTTCRSCGAGMVFIKTGAGKALPLSVATIEERGGKRYALAHFADCPNAKEWSKP